MQRINNILKEVGITPTRYEKKGNIFIISDNENKYVIKKGNKEVFDYLASRTFDYFPEVIYLDDYIISRYEDEIDIPNEQKILDLIDLVSLLHKKTTYYENITQNDIKQVYEDILNDLDYLKRYYDILMTNIESKELYSPAEYYLARNISLIISSLNKCEIDIKKWYSKIKDNTSWRVCLIHNNLKLEHFINNKLISFEHAKIDIPIFDLYKLYKETYNITNWYDLYLRYNLKFKLNEEEQNLFIILILLPDKIEFKKNEYDNTLLVTKEIDYLIKTQELINKIKTTKK